MRFYLFLLCVLALLFGSGVYVGRLWTDCACEPRGSAIPR